MSTAITQDRRKIADRRGMAPPPLFPFFDSEDTLVRQDRRHIPDRRINNIYVEDPNLDDPNLQIDQELGDKRLFIWYNDEIREVQRQEDGFWLGRSATSMAKFSSRFVSRLHAKLCYQDSAYYLIDNSTNGTYVKNDDGEVFVTKEQVMVRGSGIISLGVPFEHADSDVIHYFIG